MSDAREYGVETCECGSCEFDGALMDWTQEAEGFVLLSEDAIRTWRPVTGCGECLNRLGTSEDGRAWREAMVPRSDFDAARYRANDWGTFLAYQAAEQGDDALCCSLFAQCGFADLGGEWNWDTRRITEWLYNSFKYGWRATGVIAPLEGSRRLPVDPDPAIVGGHNEAMVPRSALEQAQAEAATFREALLIRLCRALNGWTEANDRAEGDGELSTPVEGWTNELKVMHDDNLIEAENIYELFTGVNRADIGEIIDWANALAATEEELTSDE